MRAFCISGTCGNARVCHPIGYIRVIECQYLCGSESRVCFLPPRIRISFCALILAIGAQATALCFGSEIVVSVPDQEMALIARGKVVARYPVSTSKFGIGDGVGSYRTPLGVMFVSSKVGDGLPSGAVIKSRGPTGEVIAPDAAGRDPIVSQVLWLRGKETQNRNARDRCIYIHGTAEEKWIGKRASFGCVRMRSKDVIALLRPGPYRHAGDDLRQAIDRLPTARRTNPSWRELIKTWTNPKFFLSACTTAHGAEWPKVS